MRKALSDPLRYPKSQALAERTQAVKQETKSAKRKAKNWQATIKRIWGYLARRKAMLTLVLLMVMISSGLSLLGPYLIGVAIDQYLEGAGGTPWLLFLVALAAVYVLGSVAGWLQNVWMISIAQETVYRMRLDLFKHLHRLPIPFYAKRQRGELMSRMTNDMDNVSSTLNSSAIQIFSSALILVGTVVVMLLLSPLLTLLTFLVVPLMSMGMKWITRRTGVLFKERQRNLGDLNGYIEETLSGQRIVKAFSREEAVIGNSACAIPGSSSPASGRRQSRGSFRS